MDFIPVAILVFSAYICILVFHGLSDYADSIELEERKEYKYVDDEPDGSNYVTLPDGERRLD